MKTQQWQLRKITEPHTLADVPSSREKPVLCWCNGTEIGAFYAIDVAINRVVRDGGERYIRDTKPDQLLLYAQPSRPTRLEEVPDRRVILFQPAALRFRDGGIWKDLTGNERRDTHAGDWQLTDCVVGLVEVEVGVVG